MLVRKLSKSGSLVSRLLRHNRCRCACHVVNKDQSNAMQASRRYSDQRAVSLSYDVHEPKQTASVGSHPVLILHGVYGSKKNWESLAKRMAHELSRTIVTIDARNHGQSTHSSTMSYEAMVNDLLSLMELDLMTDRCDLVGHSMGGRTAMLLAMSHPEALKKLVVVDVTHKPVAVTDDVTQAADYIRIMRDAQLDNTMSLSQAKRDLGTRLRTAIPNVGVRNFLLTNLVQEEGHLRWRVNLDALESNMENLRQLHIPPGACFTGDTLFVGGANSTYLRPEDFPEVKAIFPNATFASIEGAGHWVHSEKPADFLKAILPFLKDST